MGIKRKYTFNENFFAKTNLLNSYWAGLIAADGYIYYPRYGQRILCLQLHIKDLVLLQRFKKDINYTAPITFYTSKTTDTCILSIRSDKLCADLKKNFNITPRKSLTLKPPKKLTWQQKFAFITGYIDGDGSILVQKKRAYNNKIYPTLYFEVLGTKPMLLWIKKILLQNVKYAKKHILIAPKSSIYRLCLTGTRAEQTVAFLSKVPVKKLDRKWDNLRSIKKVQINKLT